MSENIQYYAPYIAIGAVGMEIGKLLYRTADEMHLVDHGSIDMYLEGGVGEFITGILVSFIGILAFDKVTGRQ